MKKACDENVSLCGATNGVRLLKSAWVRPAVQLARYILALSVHVCMKFKAMCTGRGWFNSKFEYSAEEMFQFPPWWFDVLFRVCFINKKINLRELQEWEDAALVMLCRGGPPYLENSCLCDGKLGIIITDMNQRLQGLNPGYKNCGGKTNFLQQRTTRTPQQRGMISWRPEAGQEEQEPGGFWDHPPQAPRKLSFHWFMLNGTSLCMMLDLRENTPLNQWKTSWRSAVGPAVCRFTPLSPHCCFHKHKCSFFQRLSHLHTTGLKLNPDWLSRCSIIN